MAFAMTSSIAGTRLATPSRVQSRQARAVAPAASLRQDAARVAKGAGISIATLGLALSAHAANVKLGADGGGLAFDPATVTIKAGESVTWTNNVGFPHNVVFDEDEIPVSFGTVAAIAHASKRFLCLKSDPALAGGSERRQPVPRGLPELTRTEGQLKVLQARNIQLLL